MADVPRHWIAPLLLTGSLAIGGGGGVTYSLAERVATLERIASTWTRVCPKMAARPSRCRGRTASTGLFAIFSI
jgi:hypothetical protein